MKTPNTIVVAAIALSLAPALEAAAPTTAPQASKAPQKADAPSARGHDMGAAITGPTGASLPGGNTHQTPSRASIGVAPMEFSVDCTLDGRLDVNDFVCFQKAFVAGSPSANCDGSGFAPVLNVLDFMCFLNEFNAKVESQSSGGTLTSAATGSTR